MTKVMKIEDIIQKLKGVLKDVAAMECETPQEAEWQRDFLDLLGINIELLQLLKERRG